MEPYILSAIVTILTAVMLFVLSFFVGLARGKHGVKTVNTYSTTEEEFIVASRVHMNTLEGMMVFLPLLWIATLFSGLPTYAAILGFVWIISRVVYAAMYYRNTVKRLYGFVPSVFCLVGLLGLSLYGVFINL